MVVPEFIPHENGGYIRSSQWVRWRCFTVFLRNQIGQHSYFFQLQLPRKENEKRSRPEKRNIYSVNYRSGGIVTGF